MGGFIAVTARNHVTFANELARLRGGDLDAIGELMATYQH